MHRLLLLLGALLLVTSPAFPREVTLAWDPNTEPDIAGYKIYYQVGTGQLPLDGSGAAEGDSPIDVGNVVQATVSGLDPGDIYYFAVTAYNDAGYESAFSNMVATDPLPVLLTPEDGSEAPAPRGIFTWRYDSENPDVTYTLYYGTDPAFATSVQSAAPPPAGSPLPPTPPPAAGWAAAAVAGALLLLTARRRLAGAAALTAFGMALCLSACGGGGGESLPFLPDSGEGDTVGDGSTDGGSTGGGENDGEETGAGDAGPPPPPTRVVTGLSEPYREVFDLEEGKTFYWKVVAHDGGQDRESEVGSFTVY